MPVSAAVAASPSARAPRLPRRAWVLLGVAFGIAAVLVLLQTTGAHAAASLMPTETGDGDGVTINGINGTPSDSIMTLLGITVLSVAPALLLMMSSFTKIFVVLALTRNALSLPSIPPNQVLAGLSLFLTLFIMWPVLTDINAVAVAPFTDGQIDFGRAFELAQEPLRLSLIHI